MKKLMYLSLAVLMGVLAPLTIWVCIVTGCVQLVRAHKSTREARVVGEARPEAAS